MSLRRTIALRRSAAFIAVMLSLAALAGWFVLRGHNAWAPWPASQNWPMYAGIHQGRVIVLSSVWDGGLASNGWLYDAAGTGNLGHILPRYTRVGDTYGGTPPFKSLLYAASVPIWYAAVPFALLARHQVRRARAARSQASGSCPRCEYSIKDLHTSTCPECGWTPKTGRGLRREEIQAGSDSLAGCPSNGSRR